jgi:hypothetical protein
MVRATVEVTMRLEIEADDAVVDELMSEDWQSHFYTFDTRDEAIAWLAWVVDDWGGPQHVDGLAHRIDAEVRVRQVGGDQDVVR